MTDPNVTTAAESGTAAQVRVVARQCRLAKAQSRAFEVMVAHEVGQGRTPTFVELVQIAAAAKAAAAAPAAPGRADGVPVLLTYRQAAAELGYRSVDSVLARVEAGQLTVVRLPATPGARRALGSPRISSEEVDRLRRRIDAEARAAGGGATAPHPADVRPPPSAGSDRRRSKVRTQRPTRLRHYE